MTSVPGIDHPEEQTEADVTLTGRGVSVNALVEVVHDGVISVRPSVGEYGGEAVARVGDVAEVFWRTPDEQRALPAQVESAETGAIVRWRLRVTGPAEQSQRRKAVRARVTVPVEVGLGSQELTGESVDLSEAGMRVQVDGFGLAPDSGARLDLLVKLEDGELKTKAEVVRLQDRGRRWLLSLKFLDLTERDGDRLRRRVFQALREERARTTD
jgi:hypothetical protein